MELFWRDNLVCPTEDEYLQMVNNSPAKIMTYGSGCWLTFLRRHPETSGLFRVAIRLMLALAQSGKDESVSRRDHSFSVA